MHRPDPHPDGEQEQGLRRRRRVYVLDGEPAPHDGAELHNLADAELGQLLRRGPRHGLDEQIELESRARCRGDAHVRRVELLPGGDAGQEVLPRGRVRVHERRGAGEVDGDEEDGLIVGGGADGGDGRAGPALDGALPGGTVLLRLDGRPLRLDGTDRAQVPKCRDICCTTQVLYLTISSTLHPTGEFWRGKGCLDSFI